MEFNLVNPITSIWVAQPQMSKFGTRDREKEAGQIFALFLYKVNKTMHRGRSNYHVLRSQRNNLTTIS